MKHMKMLLLEAESILETRYPAEKDPTCELQMGY